MSTKFTYNSMSLQLICFTCRIMPSHLRRTPKQVPVLVEAAMARLGERLQKARKLRHMPQEQLASLSDVSVSTLRALEAGADGVSLGNALKVLKGLGLLDQFEDVLSMDRDPETVAYAERHLAARR